MKTLILTLLALSMVAPAFGQEAPAVTDRGPTAIRPESPDYPKKLRRKKVEGVVIVEVVIGTDGKVETAEAVESPDERLSELAVAAAREWLFLPALKDGQAVEARVRLPFTFAAKGVSND